MSGYGEVKRRLVSSTLMAESGNDDVAFRSAGVRSALNDSGEEGVDGERGSCSKGEGIGEVVSTWVSNVDVDTGGDPRHGTGQAA